MESQQLNFKNVYFNSWAYNVKYILNALNIDLKTVGEKSCNYVTKLMSNFIRKTFGIGFSSWVKQNRTRLLLCSRWNKRKFRRHSFYLRMREILTGNKDFICILFCPYTLSIYRCEYFRSLQRLGVHPQTPRPPNTL